MARKHKYVVKLLVASGGMLALILVLTLLKSVNFLSESVFTRGISRAYIFVAGHITGLFPFSVFEILVGTAIILALVSIVKWSIYLKRKQFYKVARGLSRALTVLLTVILVYTATASFSYYRSDITGHVPMSSEKPDLKTVMEMVDYYTRDYNALAEKMSRDENGNVVCPYTFNELAIIMQEEMQRLDSDYFNPYTPRPKKIIAGDIMGAFGTLGISFQPTGEANIGSQTVAIDLPSLMAHELTHSKGVMRENDAVFVAAYITLTSDNDYIRYSGYCNNFYNIKEMLYLNDIMVDYAKEGYTFASPLTNFDLTYRFESYAKYPDVIDKVGTFFNNLYLKMSGVEEGTDSYTVVGDVTVIKPPQGGETQRIIHYSTIQKSVIFHYETMSEK